MIRTNSCDAASGLFRLSPIYFFALAIIIIGLASAPALHPQALGWEGETGVFVTPLAYTASAPGQKLHPVIAYHYFNAGPVIGDFHEVSTEVGLGQRVELGYTREFHIEGGDATLSRGWQNGFDIFNGKVTLVPENYKKNPAVPTIALGFMARTGDRNGGNCLTWNPNTNNGKNNADFYVVASKLVTQTKKVPLVLNFGLRETDAELWGMSGNAPGWQARPFGALAFVLTGPRKSAIIIGSEAAMQPHHPYGYTSSSDMGGVALNIPTTLSYCMRVIPSPKHKLNFDFGVAQIAGQVAPGVNVNARHQLGTQVSYGF